MSDASSEPFYGPLDPEQGRDLSLPKPELDWHLLAPEFGEETTVYRLDQAVEATHEGVQPDAEASRAASTDRILAQARAVLFEIDDHEHLRSMYLFPDRLNPIVVSPSQVQRYWAERRKNRVDNVRIVTPEVLQYFVTHKLHRPTTSWDEHIGELEWRELGIKKYLPPRFQPGRSQELRLADEAQSFEGTDVYETIIDLSLPTWLTRRGRSERIAVRQFQVPLLEISLALDALSSGAQRKLGLERFAFTTLSRRDRDVLTQVQSLLFELRRSISHDAARHAMQFDAEKKDVKRNPHLALANQPTPEVLDALLTTIQREGIEVSNG